MADELKKALDEANIKWEHNRYTAHEAYLHFADLALKAIEEKDKLIKDFFNKTNYKTNEELKKRIAELESKLTAIREALMTDEEMTNLVLKECTNIEFDLEDWALEFITNFIKEQRNRIQKILDE